LGKVAKLKMIPELTSKQKKKALKNVPTENTKVKKTQASTLYILNKLIIIERALDIRLLGVNSFGGIVWQHLSINDCVRVGCCYCEQTATKQTAYK